MLGKMNQIWMSNSQEKAKQGLRKVNQWRSAFSQSGCFGLKNLLFACSITSSFVCFFFCLLLSIIVKQGVISWNKIYYRALTDLIFPCLSCHCKPRLPSQFGFNNGCAWVFLELSVLPYFGDCLDRWLNPNENWFDNSTGCRPDKRLLSRYEKRQ